MACGTALSDVSSSPHTPVAPVAAPPQIPASPRAVVLMVHGCSGTAFNFWAQGPTCQQCRGMPEQMSHTMQALRLGYAGAPPWCLPASALWRDALPASTAASWPPLATHLRLPACAEPDASLPAVIAVSSLDTSTGCWSFNEDSPDVRDLLKEWLEEHK